jgi:dihydrodipicolinate synthase/N-acetylneuraminate lyase
MSEPDFLCGAYCPLIVPFRDGKIDFDTYGKLIERQIAEGTHGLLVNATSGEPTTLTVEERGQLVEFAIKTSNGRRPVCAGTASESFEATAELIDRFDKAGANSILVVTPFYSAPRLSVEQSVISPNWASSCPTWRISDPLSSATTTGRRSTYVYFATGPSSRR